LLISSALAPEIPLVSGAKYFFIFLKKKLSKGGYSMTREMYSYLMTKPTSQIAGMKLLITGYMLSGSHHGATETKASSVGRVVEAIQLVSRSQSIQVYISSDKHHFHFSEIEFIPAANQQNKSSGPSKLEYNLESCDKFFLKG
jgi:hypothetical protein